MHPACFKVQLMTPLCTEAESVMGELRLVDESFFPRALVALSTLTQQVAEMITFSFALFLSPLAQDFFFFNLSHIIFLKGLCSSFHSVIIDVGEKCFRLL